ncbi:zinc finger protein 383-like isoform X2 [Agrilus planipennis]|uniref:Zinc finger protein 383-like isoform X2 n=1 Tax=Agrilus planipennis TaxID=224129 RepID=A0A1W4X4D6_AGRPL|nr:zinc finger protein 383-like isoform X2 [Agrilus planipennis]
MESARFSPRARSNKKLVCSVKGCNSTSNRDLELCFHYFPIKTDCFIYIKNIFGKLEKKKKLECWMKAIGVNKVNSGMKICSRHFYMDDYILPNAPAKLKRLKKSAVPSLNLPHSTNEKSKHDRKVRVLKRNIKKSNVTEKLQQVELMNCHQSVVDEDISESVQDVSDVIINSEQNAPTYSEKCKKSSSTKDFGVQKETSNLLTVKSELYQDNYNMDGTGHFSDQESDRKNDILNLDDIKEEIDIKKEAEDNIFVSQIDDDIIKEETIIKNELLDNNTLKVHVQAEERPFKCETCGQKFTQKISLRNHEMVHTGERPFECPICGKRFIQKSILFSRHISIHTGKEPYECQVCQKKYLRKQHIDEHMHIHTGEKPYECQVCQKRFSKKRNFDQHMVVHSIEKPHECQICLKRFSIKRNLDQHMVIHTGEKRYECQVCQKRYLRKYQIDEHMYIHMGETPFQCETCKQRFTHKKDLTSHLRIHTGEKLYACQVCQKRFDKKSHLNRHLRVHTGEKPYECQVCHKRFLEKRNFDRHIMRIHIGEKPYECQVCQKRFSEKSCLNRHTRIHTEKNM